MDEGAAESNFHGNILYTAGLRSQGSLVRVGEGRGSRAEDSEFFDSTIDQSEGLGQAQTPPFNVEGSGSDVICIQCIQITCETSQTLGMTGGMAEIATLNRRGAKTHPALHIKLNASGSMERK